MIFPPGFDVNTIKTGQDELLSYPVWSKDYQFEGAFKRFKPMPTPTEVYQYALLGLPNIFPILNEMIPLSYAEDALESAISEMEMSMGMDISPVIHYHSEDYIAGKFGSNYSGISLFRWPATKILKVSLKYPFAGPTPYQEYVFPGSWIYLRKNKMNIIAASGSIAMTSQPGSVGSAGLFSYFTGLGTNYAPGLMEVAYQSGFDHDNLPSALTDLIKTWAAHRFLTDVGPLLFPYSSVNVQIDAVSQSVGITLQTVIAAKIAALEAKKKELAHAVKNQYKNNISKTFLGV
jgi:hypothetical protein